MNAIHFRARSNNKLIYVGSKKRQPWDSAIQSRRSFAGEIDQLPLGQRSISRIWAYMHTRDWHGPHDVSLRYKQMTLRWYKRFNRRNVNIEYINTYSLNKFL